ncbi:hypothetical protein, partial [Cardiobacterium hominis]|uniref:hypothetical protein n=1 Tax=Cardiobacterium hominis TaxID=2718 RepID=UPI0028E30F2E
KTEFGFPDRRIGGTQLTAGRSPQRGTGTARPKGEKVGEGAYNADHEMKFRFFNRLLPSHQPLSLAS